MVVALLHMAFREEFLTEEATWQLVVLIPEGGYKYRGIVIVQVMWTAVVVLLNRRFTASMTYHNFLHELRTGHGTGSANIEVKLLQQVGAMREAVLHAIFLDLHKAYHSLDRSRCLDILKKYGVENRVFHLLRRYWEWLHMLVLR